MPNGDDKNWVRLCLAIDGFRARFGQWPVRVRIYPACLDNIRDHLLSAEDFARVTSKVALVADEGPMVAEDESGNSYSYGREERPATYLQPRASDWLGVRCSY